MNNSTYNTTYDRAFQSATSAYFGEQFDWRWLKAQAIAESNLNRLAISRAGAQGIMQLMPKTSAELARKLGCDDSPFDAEINIEMGVAYARSCWEIWQQEEGVERIRFMLASYNAGRRHIIDAQSAAMAKGLRASEWDDVATCLPYITGLSAQETIGYVVKVEQIHGELRMQDTLLALTH